MKKQSGGFTLIEVLVALAIIAISLGAILSTSGTQASQAAYLKQKTIAHWIAMNEMTKLQLEKQWPSLGKTDGSTEMANNEWFWQRTILLMQKSEMVKDEYFRQVEFQVFADKKHNNSLTRLIGHIEKP